MYRATVHGESSASSGALMAFRPLDPENRPAPLKRYNTPSVELPRDLRRSSVGALDVLSGRQPAPSALDDGLLGTLLFLAGGVNRVAYAEDGEPIWFRTSMSAGNLHPVEIYVVRDGVSHYQPLEHALVPLRRSLAPSASSAITLVLTGIPFRTCWKYGERGWRHLWWDAGSLLANLLAAAGAHGVPAEVAVGFPDETVARLVGIDGIDEVPLALVHLGAGTRELPAAETLTDLRAEARPVAHDVLRFPLVLDAQEQSSLRADEVDSWRAAAAGVSRFAPRVVEVPAARHRDDRLEDVVGRRGSTRVFRARSVPGELLSWTLAAATRAAPFDASPAGTLLEHYVNVHAVAGLAAGGYRYHGDTSYEGRARSDDARGMGPDCASINVSGETLPTRSSMGRISNCWRPGLAVAVIVPRCSRRGWLLGVWRSMPSRWAPGQRV